VIVNRVFPPAVGAYFKGWRSRQQERLRDVREAFAPVPVLCAPYFEQEVLGAEMLERLGEELFGERDVAAVLHERLAHELSVSATSATLRLDLPFAERERISLKKIGPELIVGVDGHRRTIILPPALAEHQPEQARFADGALQVSFLVPEAPRGR
jgi:arsenite-transporting ATPase